MSAVVETETDAEFRKHVLALNEQVKKASLEYTAAKDIALARKKRYDELNAKLSAFIDEYGKPSPQKKFNFGPDETETETDLDLGKDEPPPPIPSGPKDESPSIETLDIPAKLIQLLVDNGIETVNQFADLVECKNPKFPAGPEAIPNCGKKACKQLAAAYESLKYGDSAGYEPPLPEEVPPGVPEPVKQESGGEVLATETGESEEVESIEEEPKPTNGLVKIRVKTTVDGAIEAGQIYEANIIDGEASVEINGDPLMLMEGEFELVS